MEHNTDTLKRICFGSTQDKKQFPHYCAPDRMGNNLAPIRGAPNLGPGCYNIEEVTNMQHLLDRKPVSVKGYVMSARTAPRFPPEKKMQTPGPGEYQSFWTKESKVSSAYAPFFINAARFPKKMSEAALYPSPGTYNIVSLQSQKVSWPGRFGSPDWSLIPALEKRTVRSELETDKEFRKRRNRIAYLSLYYS
ncbi:hypothetical protein XENTR_v10005611 [Xenopus tropicalis]|uniref:Primary cilia formation n=2 Tax=Xenopus tropicalis TaxID=8364 RepID=A0A6I8PT37_XENTR|nr:protein pitchfork isoform X1 [Xenopus tropicalis]XP_017947025.1 protein pitchfork isoform X1 [Xenopus tropicalis]KAE8623444.1 hypothetical protein XENTR_v10005611 [Xenopus tropicalis]KAE8623445.1 hypothetical protein XENTR_v10005611 [Xenopus tropicalis]KAE8623446.1 hypothetical protein XENTR_v10005611 [Xenopus tropicalis]|eukprot:XP_017947025.1 PREDICTED: protein pitchfork isoform X1 [Xenopus tropicalis]